MKHLKWIFLLLFSSMLLGCNVFDDQLEGYVGDDTTSTDPGSGDPSSKIAMAPSTAEPILVRGGTSNVIVLFSKPLPSNESINWEISSPDGNFAIDSGSISVSEEAENFEIPLTVTDNSRYKGNQKFSLHIEGDNDVFVSKIIVPLDVQEIHPQPALSFSQPAQVVSEGDSIVTVDLNLSYPSDVANEINFSIGGTASQGVDYTINPENSVTFLKGETTKTIQIYPIDDGDAEDLEDVSITLTTLVEGNITIDSANNVHAALIEDNDNPALFNISGARGGSDTSSDGFLTDGSNVIASWTNAAGETGYEATIFRNDGTTIMCSTVTKAADVTSHDFSSCSLDEGETYRISVVALLGGGDTSPAGNNMYPFTVITEPPTNFSIMGAMGGLDITPDEFLAGSLEPTITWADASGESGYDVTITNLSGVTVCPTESVAANVTSFSFSSCTLSASTSYEIQVVATNIAGQTTTAQNNEMEFLVTTNPSGYLILGVTGGVGDTTKDANMDDGNDAVVHWQPSLNAVNYDITILNMDDSVKCPTINVPASLNTISVSGCVLDLHEQYKLTVVAYDAVSTATAAANSPYVFRNRVGLYISGTGGSYLRGQSVTICGGGGGDECTLADPYVASEELTESRIRIANNGVISGDSWTSEAPTVGNGVLEITSDYLRLESGGRITMNTKGYPAETGPGAGEIFNNHGSGAGYGGLGGIRPGALQGQSYGSSINPLALGSGGGNGGSGAVGGAGGGIILINVSNELIFDNGIIEANGQNGGTESCGSWCDRGAGGGSGGSVNITAERVSGTNAVITANGGNGPEEASAGAGGRLAFYYEDMAFTGGVSAISMRTYGGTSGGTRSAAAGTVFYKDITDDPNGYLIADNNNIQHNQMVETPLPTSLVFDDIITRNLGTFVVPSTDTYSHFSDTLNFRLVLAGVMNLNGGSLDFTIASDGYLEWRRLDAMDDWDTITIQSGGVLSHSQNFDQKTFKLDINVTDLIVQGSIDANYRGYAPGRGEGAGSGGFGASYGGQGGIASSGSRASPYGNPRTPQRLGSGSGSSLSDLTGYGGGLVQITANNVDLDGGTITVNGQNGNQNFWDSGGGGSGGSIYIVTQDLNGSSASLSAIGGYGTGGGSGGRIAINYNNDFYTGGVSSINYLIHGGSGSRHGAAGTAYHIGPSDTLGHLLVLNDPRNYDETAGTEMLDTIGYDSITTDTSGTVFVPIGLNFDIPSDTIDYRMMVEGQFTIPAGGADLTISSGGYLEWRKGSPLVLNSLTIDSGGELTHTSNTSARQYFISVQANSMTINGLIDANYKGYAENEGPGAPAITDQGASHGGYGGLTDVNNVFSTAPYNIENLKSPNELGSGGSASDGRGGRGGGYVRLDISGTLALGGTIQADGEGGCCGGWDDASGGSGGSIYITAGTITGSDTTITTNGGDRRGTAGNGSGGRVSIVATTDSFTSGLASLIGASKLTSYGGTSSVNAGAAGTIYLANSSDTNGRLYVDNNSYTYTEFVETPIAETQSFDSINTTNNGTLVVTLGQNYSLLSSNLDYRLVVSGIVSYPSNTLNIQSGGYFEWRRLTPMTLTNLTIESGGVLTHTSNVNSKQYALNVQATDIDLQSGGLINVDGKGYTAQAGPGGGSGGGAYGGNSISNSSYGSIISPQDLGSGGSIGAGGGGVNLTVSNGITLNGTIQARGVTEAGAGAGGAVLIDTDTLSGSTGTINVNGGDANSATTESGAGGRIAILYNTDSYTSGVTAISMTAYGGDVGSHAGAGTIFYQNKGSDPNGHLIVNNPGRNFDQDNTTTLPNDGEFDSIDVGSGGVVEIKAGQSFTLSSSTLDFHLILGGDANLPSAATTLTIDSSGTLEFRRGTAVNTFPNVVVNSGGLITHTENEDIKTYWVHLVTNSLTLDGNINVNGKGFSAGNGAGGGSHLTSGVAAGGSYAGIANPGDSSVGSTYGSVKLPNDLGSGGGNSEASSNTLNGGAGGGLVILDVNGNFTFNGSITADGAVGESSSPHFAGGGSGGGIRIDADNLLGMGGVLSAKGAENPGANGGGGRISFTVNVDDSSYNTGSLLGVTMEAFGGTTSSLPGGAGTIYYFGPSDTDGHLLIDNDILSHVLGSETELISGDSFDSFTVANSNTGVAIRAGIAFNMMTSTLDFPLRMVGTAQFNTNDLTITGFGELYFARTSQYTLNNLTMQSGSLLSHTFNGNIDTKYIDLQILNTFDLQSGATVDVSAMGFGPGQGLGRGEDSGGTLAGGGASFGGLGGGGVSGVSNEGSIYGSNTNPQRLGSGGANGTGACQGGAGGGLIRFTVATMDFNGDIIANGENAASGACSSGGGGSGGGVYMNVTTMNGSTGTVSANGGDAPTGATNGGGGGGGRIAIYATTDNFTGDYLTQVQASGGNAEPDRLGLSGTVITP